MARKPISRETTKRPHANPSKSVANNGRATNAAQAAGLITQVQYALIPGAAYFSFLAQCKPAGAGILEHEGEMDRLCDDPADRTRADIHIELVDMIVRYLKGPN